MVINMSITPIEMYTMIPKSREAASLKSAEAAKLAGHESSIKERVDKKATENSRMTVKTSESDNPEFRYDAKEKGKGSYYSGDEKKKENNREEKKDKKDTNPIRPGSFDIRI